MIELLHFSREECERRQREADELLGPPVAETARLLDELGARGKANEWLDRSAWKRSLALLLYGDLLREKEGLRVLDAGGGLSALTVEVAKRHDFTLVERADHEEANDYQRVEERLGRDFAVVGDWFELEPADRYDVVIAVDLFPNVDQRLEEFVDRFIPLAGELRLSLTYYENTVFNVRRIESGERLTVKPWGLREVRDYLVSLADREGWAPPDERQLVYDGTLESMFGNRRNVLAAWIRP